MSILYIDVVQEQVTAAEVTVYTAPTSTDFESAHIIYGNCTNESAVNTELTINVVQSSGSVSVSNRYFPPSTIFAGRTDPLSPLVGRVIKAGDFIATKASLASNLNLSIAIKEIYNET